MAKTKLSGKSRRAATKGGQTRTIKIPHRNSNLALLGKARPFGLDERVKLSNRLLLKVVELAASRVQ